VAGEDDAQDAQHQIPAHFRRHRAAAAAAVAQRNALSFNPARRNGDGSNGDGLNRGSSGHVNADDSHNDRLDDSKSQIRSMESAVMNDVDMGRGGDSEVQNFLLTVDRVENVTAARAALDVRSLFSS
jgi:hypothetical protein